jgi:hypothetical protein
MAAVNAIFFTYISISASPCWMLGARYLDAKGLETVVNRRAVFLHRM